ncbi:MAG: methyltransferase domain-containing protein [Spirochaetes bacterium]|nr:methyltransferase domain-containing protein [Spirochaetota bacterium]
MNNGYWIAVGLVLACLVLGSAGCSAGCQAWLFNREAADSESMADRVVEALNVREGDTVADLGSGGGYFTVKFAAKVGPRGKVYAVDVDREMLVRVAALAKENGLSNIETVAAKEDGSGLEKASVDLVFVRNVYHHLPEREKYFANLRAVLKPGGRVAIVEYQKKQGFTFTGLFGHQTPEEEVVALMERAGYARKERFDFLPRQSFNTFTAK